MRHPLALVAILSVTSLGLSADDQTAITHSFLATGGHTFIVEAGKGEGQGKITWEYPMGTREGAVLANGNVILAISKSGEYPHGGAVEVTRAKVIVWEYKGTQDEVNSIQKTPTGSYVLTESGPKPRLLEIDASGKILVDFPLQPQTDNTHMQTRMARKQADGTYLVPHLLAFAIKHYKSDGTVLDVLDTTTPGDTDHKVESWPFTAIHLPNNHILAGLTHSNTVVEFDAHGKRVWELGNQDVDNIIKDACGIQRLPNGDTIVNSYAAGSPNEVRLFEVTPEKKVVWTYAPATNDHIHNAHVFATNGVNLPGLPMR